jgi:DNA topoisomerase-2
VINFFRHFWPDLLCPAIDEEPVEADENVPFLSAFVTPLLKARRGKKEVLSFYSAAEFNKWKTSIGADFSKYSTKYYKGLGTSTPEEAKEYFLAFEQHVRPFRWNGGNDGELLDMAFEKERAADRRDWINETFDKNSSIYGDEETQLNDVSYQDFVNKELIHFSHVRIRFAK